MPYTRLFAAGAILLATLMLTGCFSPSLKIGVSSTAWLNVDESQEPLPVVVRIYQLAETGPFLSASFEDLWQRDMQVLADSLVMKHEVVMDPADQKRFEMARHDQAKYVAAIAVFRDPSDGNWRAVERLPSTYFTGRLTRNVRVALSGNTIRID